MDVQYEKRNKRTLYQLEERYNAEASAARRDSRVSRETREKVARRRVRDGKRPLFIGPWYHRTSPHFRLGEK